MSTIDNAMKEHTNDDAEMTMDDSSSNDKNNTMNDEPPPRLMITKMVRGLNA
jgi:hypothetical protein